MGLSASQARLLSLTARQSNLEYEGQQINQQRTTLSNESSNYYNSLLEMSVPVPPSTNDYTKVVYTFTIGGNEATVKESLPQNDEIGNTTYFVKYTTQLSTIGIQENEAYKTAASARKTVGAVKQSTDGEFNKDKIYYLGTMNQQSEDEAASLKADNQTIYVVTDSLTYTGKDADGNDVEKDSIIIGANGYQISKEAYENCQDEYKKECRFYREYKDSATDGTSSKYAISYAQIPNEATFNAHNTNAAVKDMIFEYDSNGDTPGFYSFQASNQSKFTVVDPKYAESFVNADLDINDYYQYEATSGVRFVKRADVEGNFNSQAKSVTTSAVSTISKTKENTLSNARIEFDSQGRISTITDEEGHTYAMTAKTETDNAAYDDAYNQYEYNQYIYDQRQSEINANIEILQAQDKSLELRLSTLDTQHSAIQTEMEAVKKVMSKNIDNSFKTFNA